MSTMLNESDEALVQYIQRQENPPAELFDFLSGNALPPPKKTIGRVTRAGAKSKATQASASRLLSLATAVARAAHENPGPCSMPAWRAAIVTLRSLSSHSSIGIANFQSGNSENVDPQRAASKTERAAVAAVETYAALYSLEVMENPGCSLDEKLEALKFSAQALQAVLLPQHSLSGARKISSNLSVAVPKNLHSLMSSSSEPIQMSSLLPCPQSHCSSAGNVVLPCLISRLYDQRVTAEERLSTARALIPPWLKFMHGSDCTDRNAEIYARKVQNALCLMAKEPNITRERALKLRMFAVSQLSHPSEYAKNVLKNGLSFLRSADRSQKGDNDDNVPVEDYQILAQYYEDAICEFDKKLSNSPQERAQLHSNEEACSWHDHLYLVFGKSGSEKYSRIASSIARKRQDILAKSFLASSMRLQALLVCEGLYSALSQDKRELILDLLTRSSKRSLLIDRLVAMSHDEHLEAEPASVSDEKKLSQRSHLMLRTLRTLEPFRRVLCYTPCPLSRISSTDTLEPTSVKYLALVKFLSAYISVSLRGINESGVEASKSDPRVSTRDTFINDRLRGMAGAALTACETLLNQIIRCLWRHFAQDDRCLSKASGNLPLLSFVPAMLTRASNRHIQNSDYFSNEHANALDHVIQALCGIDAIVTSCRDIALAILLESDYHASKQGSQWALWLSIMLNNAGIDIYNRFAKLRQQGKSDRPLKTAASLMETSAFWLLRSSDSPTGSVCSSSTDSSTLPPCCTSMDNSHRLKYVRRLASATDAYLAAEARGLLGETANGCPKSLQTSFQGLHAAFTGTMALPEEAIDSFSRSIIASVAMEQKINPSAEDELDSRLVDELKRHVDASDNHQWYRMVLETIREYSLRSLRKRASTSIQDSLACSREDTVLKVLRLLVRIILVRQSSAANIDQISREDSVTRPGKRRDEKNTSRKMRRNSAIQLEQRLGIDYDLHYLDARLETSQGCTDGLRMAMTLKHYFEAAHLLSDAVPPEQNEKSTHFPPLEENSIMKKKGSGNVDQAPRSSQATNILPDGEWDRVRFKIFAELANAWLAVEGLDSTEIGLCVSRLREYVSMLSPARQLQEDSRPSQTKFLWFDILELTTWIAFTLARCNMDEPAYKTWMLARSAANTLRLPFDFSQPAEICRRLGWSNQCLRLLKSSEPGETPQCAAVHGRVLNDLGKYGDALRLLRDQTSGNCCDARAAAELLCQGNLNRAYSESQQCLKLVLGSLVKTSAMDKSRDERKSQVVSIMGHKISAVVDLQREKGRAKYLRLLELVYCLRRMTDLCLRLDNINDAVYYVHRAADLSSELSAPCLHALIRTYSETLPASAQRYEMPGGGDCSAVTSPEQELYDASYNPLVIADLLTTQGDAMLCGVQDEYDGIEIAGNKQLVVRRVAVTEDVCRTSHLLDVIEDALSKYDEATSILSKQTRSETASQYILQRMTTTLRRKTGHALLCKYQLCQEALKSRGNSANLNEIQKTFLYVQSVPSVGVEERFEAMIGLAETLLVRSGECIGERDQLLQRARHALQTRLEDVAFVTRCAPRIAKKYFRTKAAVEMELDTEGNVEILVESLVRAHGTCFIARQALARSNLLSHPTRNQSWRTASIKPERSEEVPGQAVSTTKLDDKRRLEADEALLSHEVRKLKLDDSSCGKTDEDMSFSLQDIRHALGERRCILVGLTLSAGKRHLYLWRVCPSSFGDEGTCVKRLSLPQSQGLTLTTATETLRSVLETMKEMSTGDAKLSAKEKASWWKRRFELDHRVGQLMAEIEAQWIGAARVLLLPLTMRDSSRMMLRTAKSPSSVSHEIKALALATAHMPDEFSPSDVISLPGCGEHSSEADLQLLCKELRKLGGFPETEGLVTHSNVVRRGQHSVTANRNNNRYRVKQSRSTRNRSSKSQDDCRDPKAATELVELCLAIDKDLEHFPWECLPLLRSNKCGITRLPNVAYLTRTTENWSGYTQTNPRDVFYLLNPSGDLVSTQQSFQQLFEEQTEWHGKVGQRDTLPNQSETLTQLQKSDIFLYLGHGGGEEFIPPRQLSRLSKLPVSLLMGCSSGALQRYPGLTESSGTIVDYLLSGSPAVVGNLWDVSDRDIDRLTAALLSRWLGVKSADKDDDNSTDDENSGANDPSSHSLHPGQNTIDRQTLAVALANARDACRLPFLVGAATVIYGNCGIR